MMTINKTVIDKVEVKGAISEAGKKVLTPEALDFVAALVEKFEPRRQELLARRSERQKALDSGLLPDFSMRTTNVREGEWTVAPAPADLEDRRVEITGPVERKMMINALNCGAKVFMADLEDSLSPTWTNVVEGQLNLMEAVRRTLSFKSPEGKSYDLKKELATLVVRPRGWHLSESHVRVKGEPVSASLFDFGLYFFHNARELMSRESGPYFYLPKLESYHEARLWNDVFNFAQDYLEIPRGTIRATVLIETILAAFEMDEILFELKEHASGLNAGRWDYIFSMIKKLGKHAEFCLPDRAQVTMAVPFMRAYAQLLVKTCHRRGAHAIGGMAAFIPSRKDAKVNETAFAKVREDKLREATDGFDGTWVAHPDLVPVAKAVFDEKLQGKAHQKDVLREDVKPVASYLLSPAIGEAKITREGLVNNIDVALQYIEAWLKGSGAVAIYNLMEDAATAEISRSQVWQWINVSAHMHDGTPVTRELYTELKETILEGLKMAAPDNRFDDASRILDELVLADEFVEFLTIPAGTYIES